MNLRLLLRRSLALLPRPVRFEIMRRQLNINLAPSPRLEVKLADTEAELECAFRILHESYVDSGFMKPTPSGLRVTKYHALPSTSTLVAKWDGQVIATLSIIRDGAFGLPLESSFDIRRFRAGGRRPVEISSLAILPSFRGNRGEVLLPLLKTMWLYCTKSFGVDDLLIAVNPRRVEFFEAILNFSKITDEIVPEYGFVNGAPAVGLYLNTREARPLFAQAYYRREPERDLYTYMIDVKEGGRFLPNIHLPERTYFNISDPILTPALFRAFFMEKTDVFQTLTEQEKRVILAAYQEPGTPAYQPAAAGWSEVPAPERRRRYDVNFEARVQSEGGGETDGRVLNVSRTGILLATAEPLATQDFYTCRIRVSEFEVTQVTLQRIWEFGGGLAGMRVIKADPAWERMLAHFEKSFDSSIYRQPA